MAGHKRWVREFLERSASEARATDAVRLAGQLAILLEGAIAVALVEQDSGSGRAAGDAAEMLIRAATPKGPGAI